MPCPLYIGLAPGNPLRICGPRDRLSYVSSLAHMKLFCLPVSAYNECPIYKRKTARDGVCSICICSSRSTWVLFSHWIGNIEA